jgi:hypothetical protein
MIRFGSAPTIAYAFGTAGALGDESRTNTATATGVGAGMAVGFSGSSATARNHDSTAPQAETHTGAETSGGDIKTHYWNDLTINFHVGSTQVSTSISIDAAGSHGFDPLSTHMASDQFSIIGTSSFTGLH